MNWYLKVLRQYADFNGRARRKEYWMFVLINIMFMLVAMGFDNMLSIDFGGAGYGPIYLIYSLALVIPSFAVGIRRLHDTGRSGWMMLLSLIPLIGQIWLIVLFATEGNPGVNEYGSNPKEMTE